MDSSATGTWAQEPVINWNSTCTLLDDVMDTVNGTTRSYRRKMRQLVNFVRLKVDLPRHISRHNLTTFRLEMVTGKSRINRQNGFNPSGGYYHHTSQFAQGESSSCIPNAGDDSTPSQLVMITKLPKLQIRTIWTSSCPLFSNIICRLKGLT